MRSRLAEDPVTAEPSPTDRRPRAPVGVEYRRPLPGGPAVGAAEAPGHLEDAGCVHNCCQRSVQNHAWSAGTATCGRRTISPSRSITSTCAPGWSKPKWRRMAVGIAMRPRLCTVTKLRSSLIGAVYQEARSIAALQHY